MSSRRVELVQGGKIVVIAGQDVARAGPECVAALGKLVDALQVMLLLVLLLMLLLVRMLLVLLLTPPLRPRLCAGGSNQPSRCARRLRRDSPSLRRRVGLR